ncbi:MAG TPA: hypothetical protein VKU19_30965 [Bryobacteraceae bacterium]|nr:hypothetical protein [Bryobacteraceae bacterium]
MCYAAGSSVVLYTTMVAVQANWSRIVHELALPALPEAGLWTAAIEFIAGPRKYKIAAAGQWELEEGRDYGPDGACFGGDIVDKCLNANAPRGCLIGKIGGGTADRTGYIFPVGHLTVIEVPETPVAAGPGRGTLFLTMNDEPARFPNHRGELRINIWEAP